MTAFSRADIKSLIILSVSNSTLLLSLILFSGKCCLDIISLDLIVFNISSVINIGILFFNAIEIASLGLESISVLSLSLVIIMLAKNVPFKYFLIITFSIKISTSFEKLINKS